jgi:hypothetical protein
MVHTTCPLCGRSIWPATEYPRPLCSICRTRVANAALERPEVEDLGEFEDRAEECERVECYAATLYTAEDGTWFEEYVTDVGALVITTSEDPEHPRIFWGSDLTVYQLDIYCPAGYEETYAVNFSGDREDIEEQTVDLLTEEGYEGIEITEWHTDGTLSVRVNDPTVCRDCGYIISWSETTRTRCDECEEYARESLVHEYDYKPYPVFHGHGTDLFYGVELEVDRGHDRLALAEQLLTEIGDDVIYCKRDGSLGYEGLEIVTHPCTLEYHMTKLDWRQICKTAREHGYTSHDAGTCGLHVHASRRALGGSYGERELTVAKLILMVDRLEEPLTVFSRRDITSLEQWAKITKTGVTPDDSESEALSKIQDAMRYDRYVAVNTQPEHTVEVRIFRGTLRFETILASIQLVDLLCQWAMTHTLNEVRAVTWQTLCEGIDSDGYLYSYCKQKGLL